MERYKYVAKLTNLNKPKEKFNHCILSISVGQKVHEGKKFAATLELINKYFKKCTIAVNDTLQRHSIAIITNSNQEIVYNAAKREGDEWIDRNKPICDEWLDVPYTIKRWENWFKHKDYSFFRKKVDKLYTEDPKFVSVVDNVAQLFVNRIKKRKYAIDDKIAVKYSKEYLLEECAAMCIWYDEGYDVEIYPSIRNDAIEYTFSQIRKDYYDKLVKPAGLKFNKLELFDSSTSKIALEKIINILPGHVYWKDAEGKFLGCNEMQARDYGYKSADVLIGKYDKNIIKADVAQRIKEKDKEIMYSKQTTCIFEEEGFINKKKKWFLSQKAPIMNNDDEVLGIIGVSIDITEQKKLEKELKKQAENLTATLETQKRFLRNMSHEIKTPLHNTLGVADILYRQWNNYSDKERKGYVKRIANSTDGLMSLISNLLDTAELKSGEMDFNMKFHDMKQLMISVLDEFKNITKKIDFKILTNNTRVNCDDYRIKQVLCNLIGNAVKHGGKDKSISIVVEQIEIKENRYLKVSVTDEGVGIPEDELKLIFDPFYESTRTRSKAGGRGVGLTICKEIIAFHKGKIWAENNEKIGSTFHFTLPYAMQETKSYALQLSGIL